MKKTLALLLLSGGISMADLSINEKNYALGVLEDVRKMVDSDGDSFFNAVNTDDKEALESTNVGNKYPTGPSFHKGMDAANEHAPLTCVKDGKYVIHHHPKLVGKMADYKTADGKNLADVINKALMEQEGDMTPVIKWKKHIKLENAEGNADMITYAVRIPGGYCAKSYELTK